MNAVRTDVVGGLQALAEQYMEAEAEVEELRKQEMNLDNKKNTALRRQADAGTRLLERVGRNVPLTAFVVGDKVLIVEHERGLRVAERGDV